MSDPHAMAVLSTLNCLLSLFFTTGYLSSESVVTVFQLQMIRSYLISRKSINNGVNCSICIQPINYIFVSCWTLLKFCGYRVRAWNSSLNECTSKIEAALTSTGLFFTSFPSMNDYGIPTQTISATVSVIAPTIYLFSKINEYSSMGRVSVSRTLLT